MAYLAMEAEQRLHIDIDDFEKPSIVSTDVPQQPNYSDCGLFVLHFVEVFFKAADAINRALREKDKRNRAWQVDEMNDKRHCVRAVFSSISDEYYAFKTR
ncbi:hypothetical protein DM01DRAFT_1073873 [Hesseltinella vesiculosa]|uniref:Ubiquitin-like protease family profile domain-containing protein n=1 Tax=Hesseltinella vesiculosa TaxID=101127 RepID=A0A1X2GVV6_9FUNG|nr:hypothetical protein DM01DRAFT_1073873 [Hesseltinella vesiculosa]